MNESPAFSFILGFLFLSIFSAIPLKDGEPARLQILEASRALFQQLERSCILALLVEEQDTRSFADRRVVCCFYVQHVRSIVWTRIGGKVAAIEQGGSYVSTQNSL